MFVTPDETGFLTYLDTTTTRLQEALPAGTRHWGAARKALNIFLRDLLYNSYLAPLYGLVPLRLWLEVPLDKDVAKGLGEAGVSLPRWLGIKHLSPAMSALYQSAASAVAAERGLARVDLDVFFYRAAEALHYR